MNRDDKLRMLSGLPVFEPKPDGGRRWLDGHDAVARFVDSLCRLPSASAKKPSEAKLGMWCQTQGQRKRAGTLSEERAEKLDKLVGWHWGAHDKWESRFRIAKAFVDNFMVVPKMYSDDEGEAHIGRWCAYQKDRRRKGLLDRRREARMETIDGWYWGSDEKWSVYLEHIRGFLSDRKCLPKKRSDNPLERQLAVWLYNQKKLVREGKLPEGKVRALGLLSDPNWVADIQVHRAMNKLWNSDKDARAERPRRGGDTK